MGLYEMVETDPVLEQTGVIFNYPHLKLRITAKRAGGANKGFNKALTRRSKDFQRALDLGAIDNDTMIALLQEVFADEVVVLWETFVDGEWKEGIEQRDGSLAPCTRENILAAFKALPYVFHQLREDAEKHTFFLASLREARAGN